MWVGIDFGDVVVSMLDEWFGYDFVVVGDMVNCASCI